MNRPDECVNTIRSCGCRACEEKRDKLSADVVRARVRASWHLAPKPLPVTETD